MRGPVGSTFAGPHSVASAEIFEGHQVTMVEIMSDVKERGYANLGVPGGMHPSFTSPAKTFHVRSVDISVTPNNSMSYYTQYLFPGQVPTAGTVGQVTMLFE